MLTADNALQLTCPAASTFASRANCLYAHGRMTDAAVAHTQAQTALTVLSDVLWAQWSLNNLI